MCKQSERRYDVTSEWVLSSFALLSLSAVCLLLWIVGLRHLKMLATEHWANIKFCVGLHKQAMQVPMLIHALVDCQLKTYDKNGDSSNKKMYIEIARHLRDAVGYGAWNGFFYVTMQCNDNVAGCQKVPWPSIMLSLWSICHIPHICHRLILFCFCN
jgi:hypothetical protein